MGWLVQAECVGQGVGRMLQVPPSYSSDTAGHVGGLRSILKLAGHLNQSRNLAQVIGGGLENFTIGIVCLGERAQTVGQQT